MASGRAARSSSTQSTSSTATRGMPSTRARSAWLPAAPANNTWVIALRQDIAGFPVRFCLDDLAAYLDGYAVTGDRLATLRVPASVLLAEDDPIVPAADLSRLAASPRLSVVRTRYGGHCGFTAGVTGPSAADLFVLREFERFDREAP